MVSQTHKTIIFEEYDKNSSKDLFTLINNDPDGDELYRGLQDLTVSSFQEFIEKFSPKIYEAYATDQQTGEIKIFYTTDPTKFKDLPKVEKKIQDHVYYKTFVRLYESKGESGKSNLQFDDNEVLEMLTPKKEIEEILNIRKKFEYNLQKLYEAEKRGDKSAMDSHTNKLIECREKIVEDYANAPVTQLLPILIEDTKTKLKLLEMTSGGTDNAEDQKSLPAYKFGDLYLNAEGKIELVENRQENNTLALEASKEENTALVEVNNNHPAEVKNISTQNQSVTPTTEEIRNEISEQILEDYEENVERKNETVKSLIVSSFAPLAESSTQENQTAPVSIDELNQKLQMYENLYTNSKQSFIDEMSKIVESFIGVKIFFDHATVEGGDYSEIPGGVIISNCKASKLLEIKEKFSKCMKFLGQDQTENQRIWFAVVPSVLENPPVKNNTVGGGKMGGSLKARKNTSQKIDTDYVSIAAIKEFLPIMENAKITTVFNIRTDKGNTFATLTAAEVEDKIKIFDSCDYGHAVYAYPNFTLILDRNFNLFDGQKAEITLPKFLIDAAYPAAGLLVASQQPKILDSRKLKYDKETSCVGINFEELDVKRAFSTKFNRESVYQRSEDLSKTINKNMFGFVFSGDTIKEKGVEWKNSYIHCARTLFKNKKTEYYKPIYQTLVEDFILQELNVLPNKTVAEIKKHVSKINQNWSDKNALKQCIGNVNFLLRDGENIEVVPNNDKAKVIIHFVGGDAYVDIDVVSTSDPNKSQKK